MELLFKLKHQALFGKRALSIPIKFLKILLLFYIPIYYLNIVFDIIEKFDK
jgi:hypothetical protein